MAPQSSTISSIVTRHSISCNNTACRIMKHQKISRQSRVEPGSSDESPIDMLVSSKLVRWQEVRDMVDFVKKWLQ